MNQWIYLVLPILFLSCKDDNLNKNTLPSETYYSLNNSDVYVKIIGEGDPLIVIHGGPLLDHTYLLPWLEKLGREHQLIFYDQRACGKSSAIVDTATMSLKGFADDIEQLRMSLNLDMISLLAHSWGGIIAMQYAAEHPEHLRSLILSNSIPPNTQEWQEEQQIISQRISEEDKNKRQEILNSQSMRDDPAGSVHELLLLSFKLQFFNIKFLDSLTLIVPDDIMERSRTFQLLAPDLSSFDYYDVLGKLSIPTLIIYGDQEPAAQLSAEKMSVKIQGSQIKILKDCGHFPFIEKNTEFLDLINNFLDF